MILDTDRLYLRNFKIDDSLFIYEYRNDANCKKYQRYDALSIEEIEEFINLYKNSTFLSIEKEQHYAIVLKENDCIVGELAYFYTENDCITLGITIAYQYQNKGLAYEILKEVIKRIREVYPLLDIVGLIEKGNKNSIKLFEKLDFKLEEYNEYIASYIFVNNVINNYK